jgi:hypothetical protein
MFEDSADGSNRFITPRLYAATTQQECRPSYTGRLVRHSDICNYHENQSVNMITNKMVEAPSKIVVLPVRAQKSRTAS